MFKMDNFQKVCLGIGTALTVGSAIYGVIMTKRVEKMFKDTFDDDFDDDEVEDSEEGEA